MFPPRIIESGSSDDDDSNLMINNNNGIDGHPLNSIRITGPIEGKVTRVSDFGVFLDVGVGFDAFLHRKKMRIGKKRRSLKSWELYPIGSLVKGWVHSCDIERSRIGMTTVPPAYWDSHVGLDSNGSSKKISKDERIQRILEFSLEGDIDSDDNEDQEAHKMALAMALEDSALMEEGEIEDEYSPKHVRGLVKFDDEDVIDDEDVSDDDIDFDSSDMIDMNDVKN